MKGRGLLVRYDFNLQDIIVVLYFQLSECHCAWNCRSEIGAWIAFIAVVIRLFFPTHIPDHSELPASLIVLLVVIPKVIIGFRFNWPGEGISIVIGGYLLYQHIISAGGFKKAFAERGVFITIGILLLFVAPIWQFVFTWL